MPFDETKPIVEFGATGSHVAYLQGVLQLEAAQNEVEVDGMFGPHTRAGVIDVQALFELPQTGIVDAPTWDAVDFLATTL